MLLMHENSAELQISVTVGVTLGSGCFAINIILPWDSFLLYMISVYFSDVFLHCIK